MLELASVVLMTEELTEEQLKPLQACTRTETCGFFAVAVFLASCTSECAVMYAHLPRATVNYNLQ